MFLDRINKSLFSGISFLFLSLQFMLILTIGVSCRNKSNELVQDPAEVNEQLTKMNKQLVENESKDIDEFISRHYFKTQRTGTGLRYEIYQHGKGRHPELHDTVTVAFKSYLLDGSLCYNTDSSGPVKFIIGIGQQIRGLEEGLEQMVPGDKSRLIIPNHLAYGMQGDLNKVPPSSAMYYDVELLEIKP
jgi:FKBP-type peptidyl-prolyl cis-trans isomerase FkpA